MALGSWLPVHLWTSVAATWSRQSYSTARAPAARAQHAMAGEMGRFWLFGGVGGQHFNDLWMFDQGQRLWVDLSTPLSPPPRADHIAVWDPGELALWVYGGNNGSVFLQDLWRFRAGTWTQLGSDPGPRSGHVAVWDDISATLWIHGGSDGWNFHRDTWRFDSQTSRWSRLTAAREGSPSAREKHVGLWDPGGAMWIHGGYNGSFCSDVWKLHFGTLLWHRMAAWGEGPSGRVGHAAAWEPIKANLWIHGGVDETSMTRGDLWRFDSLRRHWFLVADGSEPSWPVGRYNHVALWASGAMWMHGGQAGSPVDSAPFLMDLWSYRLSPGRADEGRQSPPEAAGFNGVILLILLVALFVGFTLLAVILLRPHLCGFKGKTLIMPLHQRNAQLLEDPGSTERKAAPSTVEFPDLPILLPADCVLQVDAPGRSREEICEHPTTGDGWVYSQHHPHECFGHGTQPRERPVDTAPCEGGGRRPLVNPQVPEQLPVAPTAQPAARIHLALPPAMKDVAAPGSWGHRTASAVSCGAIQLELPGLNVPGPLNPAQLGELAPVIWPHDAVHRDRAPLSLPPVRRRDPVPSALVPRRPAVPLATQQAELLMEPAPNPDPPTKRKVKKKLKKRELDTTLGGPYFTASARTLGPKLKKSPGPAHYTPQNPNIHGWVPGHNPDPAKYPSGGYTH